MYIYIYINVYQIDLCLTMHFTMLTDPTDPAVRKCESTWRTKASSRSWNVCKSCWSRDGPRRCEALRSLGSSGNLKIESIPQQVEKCGNGPFFAEDSGSKDHLGSQASFLFFFLYVTQLGGFSGFIIIDPGNF